MARTAEGESLTEAHRALQIRMAAALTRDLAVLWRPVDPTDIRGTLEPFSSAAEVVTLATRRSNALAAQEYYVAFREAEGVAGRIAVALAKDPPAGVLRGALFGSAARGLMDARARGLSVAEAAKAAFTRTAGSAVQVMANGGRETIFGAIASDDQARGYQRVTDADPCPFCRMQAGRGIVYSASTADFKSHSGCGCTAEPAFEGSRVSARNAEFRAEWDKATGTKSGADALSAYRAYVTAQRSPAMG